MDSAALFNAFFSCVNGTDIGISEDERQLAEIIHSVTVEEIQKCPKKPKGEDSDDSDDENGGAAFAEKVETSKENLKKILELFESASSSKSEFVENFPDWSELRKDNIQKLKDIEQSIQKNKYWCNLGKLTGGVIGAAGGVAVVGALLFPPAAPAILPAWLGGAAAAAYLPAWLGGAAAAAYLPAFLLPAAAPAVSSLAVGGGIAAGTGSVAMFGTKITELELLRRRMETAKIVLQADQLAFSYMENWFKHTKELTEALEKVIGFSVLEQLMIDLKIFFQNIKDLRDVMDRHKWFKAVMRVCIRRMLSNGVIALQFGMCLAALLVTFLIIILLHRRNRFIFNCVLQTNKLATRINLDLKEMTRVIAALGLAGGTAVYEYLPVAVLEQLKLGIYAGVGIAVNLATIVLTSIDIKRGSTCKQAEEVKNAAEKLQDEYDFLEEVYNNLNLENQQNNSLIPLKDASNYLEKIFSNLALEDDQDYAYLKDNDLIQLSANIPD